MKFSKKNQWMNLIQNSLGIICVSAFIFRIMHAIKFGNILKLEIRLHLIQKIPFFRYVFKIMVEMHLIPIFTVNLHAWAFLRSPALLSLSFTKMRSFLPDTKFPRLYIRKNWHFVARFVEARSISTTWPPANDLLWSSVTTFRLYMELWAKSLLCIRVFTFD